jgi:hypothetical protein
MSATLRIKLRQMPQELVPRKQAGGPAPPIAGALYRAPPPHFDKGPLLCPQDHDLRKR